MISTVFLFIFVDSILTCFFEAYQDHIGKISNISNTKIHCNFTFLGALLVLKIPFFETFIFDLFWYTIFPCIVLYCSKEDYGFTPRDSYNKTKPYNWNQVSGHEITKFPNLTLKMDYFIIYTFFLRILNKPTKL